MKKEEELDEYGMQSTPSGFHVIYLPYADDIRSIESTMADVKRTSCFLFASYFHFDQIKLIKSMNL